MLGLRDVMLVNVLFRGRTTLPPGDASERFRVVLSISVDLDGLYERDDVIRLWLDQCKPELGGRTPRAMLNDGSFENLLKVRQLVRYEARR
jgi:hypothetical protein